ncbi:hypothetical protein MBT42_39130 [Streptomyces sp. MBT42]|uniref:hypothetical protein n=1 Tax=Streptomyces sp. MBT42 TaxID=1488373 RepID=UPI001E45AC3F|nr:hypothetical protein [Streptomyces sp. MBT42]MCD2469531.1 hypothetical protein [Streptomyces sp. MBT42]
MAMLDTILATATGLGAAGLGAAGALLVQRAKRRDDAAAVKQAAEQAEKTLTLEIIATARASARAWLAIAERAVDDLKHGRMGNAERYDEQMHAVSQEFTSALYRLAGRLRPHDEIRNYRGPSFNSWPFVDQLGEVTQILRGAVHRSTEVLPAPPTCGRCSTGCSVTPSSRTRVST